jgi:hypothetical protein
MKWQVTRPDGQQIEVEHITASTPFQAAYAVHLDYPNDQYFDVKPLRGQKKSERFYMYS